MIPPGYAVDLGMKMSRRQLRTEKVGGIQMIFNAIFTWCGMKNDVVSFNDLKVC